MLHKIIGHCYSYSCSHIHTKSQHYNTLTFLPLIQLVVISIENLTKKKVLIESIQQLHTSKSKTHLVLSFCQVDGNNVAVVTEDTRVQVKGNR